MRGGRGGGELYLGQLGRLHARVEGRRVRWVRRVRGSAAARVRLGVAVRRARAGAAAARVRGRDAEPLAAHRAAHALLVALLRALRPLRPGGGGDRQVSERCESETECACCPSADSSLVAWLLILQYPARVGAARMTSDGTPDRATNLNRARAAPPRGDVAPTDEECAPDSCRGLYS